MLDVHSAVTDGTWPGAPPSTTSPSEAGRCPDASSSHLCGSLCGFDRDPPPAPQSQGLSCGPFSCPAIPQANQISNRVSNVLTAAFHTAVCSRPCGCGSRVRVCRTPERLGSRAKAWRLPEHRCSFRASPSLSSDRFPGSGRTDGTLHRNYYLSL